jgi:hypothetical protein
MAAQERIVSMTNWVFGDSFDLYAAITDAVAGFWDSGALTNVTLAAGRFTGSQALRNVSVTGAFLVKSSGSNDAIHHIVCAFQQTATLSGTTLSMYFSLGDGATAQCTIVFRSDGAILLTSGGPTGTVLATWATGVTAQSTWFAYEFEVVVNNTAGSFSVRRNGNASNDFTLGALNTRGGTTNNYANRLTMGVSTFVNQQLLDDLLWRSDAASVPWVGDVRCYTRMPASDVSAVFSRSPTVATQQSNTGGGAVATSGTIARYFPLTATYDGTVGSITIAMSIGYTGNMKCSIFAAPTSTTVGAVLGSATPISNPITGNNGFTFPAPVAVTKGTQYFVGFIADASGGNFSSTGSNGFQQNTTYAAFPTANPTVSTGVPAVSLTWSLTVGSNATLVNEPQQDGATSYVYDSNPGDADFYNLAALGVTPASVVAVTTRGFIQKSDAGTRAGAVQLKSAATTVASTTTFLGTTWGWLWRTDQNDPATSAAWTPTAVNNAQIGPTVVS